MSATISRRGSLKGLPAGSLPSSKSFLVGLAGDTACRQVQLRGRAVSVQL